MIAVTASQTAVHLAQVAATAAEDKLATDIVALDVSEQFPLSDIFVLASVGTERQISSVVESVEDALRDAGSKPLRREGERDGRWVLLDFGDIIVHVQHEEERVFYQLERLWKDCPTVPVDVEDVPAEPEGGGAADAAAEDGGE